MRSRSRIVRASTSGRGTWIIQDTNGPVPAGPFLSSIRPTSVQAGSTTAVTLTAVDGANFTPNSRVQWKSQAGVTMPVTTTFVSANKLTATLDPSLLTAADVGVHQITVVDGVNTSDFLRFSVLGAAPTITSLVPGSKTVGGLGFNLQVSGTGFNCSPTQGVGSIVFFRGVSHTPSACSQTQMTVAITASEIATGGNGNVTVFTPPPGGANSSPSGFPITAPPPTNDNFANAISASSNFTDTADTSGATTEAFDPVPPAACTANPSPNTHSIWYKFTTAANGTVTADTNGTAYDSVLQAVTGTLPTFTPVACGQLSGVNQGAVTFPAQAGVTYFFMISDFNGVGGTTVFHLTAPTVIFNPASLAFGSVAVGSASAVSNVQLSNAGTGPLTFTSIALTGTNASDFVLAVPTIVNDFRTPNTLAAGAHCHVGLKFQPAATGARSASLSVADDAAGSPQSVSLAGTGIAPAVTLAPANLAFGTQRVSTPSPVQTVALTNSGTAPLSIATAVLGGTNAGDFALASGTTCINGATLAAGANCVLNLTFTPTAASARTATVTITDDAADSPQSMSLAGTGIAPAVTFAPTNLAFGTQRVSTPSPVQTVTLTNSGTAPLSIATAVLGGADAGDFALASGTTCINGATLAAGANCVLKLTFTPTAASARTATVTITDDAADSPQSVSLAGTGIAPAASLAPTNLTFGTQRRGTPSPPQTVTLPNSSTAPPSIATSVPGAAKHGDYAPASGTTC